MQKSVSSQTQALSLLIGNQPSGEERRETKRVSAFINVEVWRNNGNTDSLSQITKSTLLTVEGYFKT